MEKNVQEIRLEGNPIEDALWYWTIGKLGLKIVALVLFGLYVIVKVVSK